MTKPLRFDNDAVEEMEMAAEWYEARRQDLGIDFVTAVREALQRVAEAPQTWSLVRGVPELCSAHRARARQPQLKV